jgi:VanZ family protein
LKKFFGNLFIPLAWTTFIQVLLCLPGNSFPSEGLFGIPQLDKIVHVVFFGAFVGLWCYYFRVKISDNNKLKRVFFIIFLIAATNGIIIEYIQFYFIPFRSFDQGDIIADILSSGIAYGICNVKLLSI